MTDDQKEQVDNAFYAWWFEVENYSLRCERAGADLSPRGEIWIRVAFQQGYEAGLAARLDECEEQADDITVLAYQHGDGRLEIEIHQTELEALRSLAGLFSIDLRGVDLEDYTTSVLGYLLSEADVNYKLQKREAGLAAQSSEPSPEDEIKALVGSLTEPERDWITGWSGPPGAALNAVAMCLVKKSVLRSPTDWRLSKRGEAVRRYLKEQTDEKT